MIKVCCIITTYNAKPWIQKCISSIAEPNIDLKILVIDNASSDGTIDIIKQNFPLVEIHVMERNLGFGSANNYGFEIAKRYNAEYIYLLNQDTISYTDNINRLISVEKKIQNVGVVAPVHLNEDGSFLDPDFEKYINAVTCKNYISDVTLGNLKEYYSIGFINAAAWLIKTETVDYLGGLFSKAFFHYGEDVNFIGRLSKFNFINIFVPEVFIHHCKTERYDGISKEFQNRVIEINKVNIMHDIKISYAECFNNIVKYAIQQLANGNYMNFFKLIFYPIFSYSQIIKFRKSYIDRNLTK